MRKEASTYCIVSAILGAFGLLLRWLQCSAIFKEEDTGLAVSGAPVSWLMALVLVGVIVGLWWLSGRIPTKNAPAEPEDAMARPNRAVGAVLIVAALAAGAGAVLLFFQTGDLLLKMAALIGLLAAPVLMLYPYLPGWGRIGAFFSVVPVMFYCLWMVVTYKNDAVNPVLWGYVVQILAIAACLYAVFQLSAYLFYRAKPRKAVFACALATVYSLISLADDTVFSIKLLLAGWGLGMAVMGWTLIANFEEDEEET